jgi:tetratricopeptide (TPR) repeat protein
MVIAIVGLGWDYLDLGQFEKSLEYLTRRFGSVRTIPYLGDWYRGEAAVYIALKQYDQTIEWARRAIAVNPNANPWLYMNLIPALALTGHEAEAHDALRNYLASVPSWPKTIAAGKAAAAPYIGCDALRLSTGRSIRS